MHNVGCNKQEGFCQCRNGFMDADNDPSNGCELRIKEKSCRFGSCKDHDAESGDECGQWGGKLQCSGGPYSCCLKTDEFVEGTTSATTTSATSTTTNEDYNIDSFEEIREHMRQPFDREWTWAVKVRVFRYASDETYSEECAGAVVHDRWVLTGTLVSAFV